MLHAPLGNAAGAALHHAGLRAAPRRQRLHLRLAAPLVRLFSGLSLSGKALRVRLGIGQPRCYLSCSQRVATDLWVAMGCGSLLLALAARAEFTFSGKTTRQRRWARTRLCQLPLTRVLVHVSQSHSSIVRRYIKEYASPFQATFT